MKKIILFIVTLVVLNSCNSQEKDYLVTLKTKFGDIKLVLYDQTPLHKENFIKLAKNGQFDSTTFHRVIPNFMIQGGDVNAKPGHENEIDYLIPPEFVDTLIHHRGALAAARQGDQINPEKKSNGSQFYIVQGNVFSEEELTANLQKVHSYLNRLAEVPGYENIVQKLDSIYQTQGNEVLNKEMIKLIPVMENRFGTSFTNPISEERLEVYTTLGGAPHLDEGYTVFGRVVEGMDVVDKIASVKTATMSRPVENVYMTVEVEEISKEEWNEKYGGKTY